MEPIAIVGIGCRFPGGVSGPEAFWALMREGRDAIVEVPRDRWDWRRYFDQDRARAGKMYVKEAGFLQEPIDHFDPLAFGMSPREAGFIDPQQRLLLEVTWEALEDGGLSQDRLRGSDIGVFVGGFSLDGMVSHLQEHNQHLISAHSATGFTMTMLANRISHAFDFRGPSVTMDTACSSSLMATHMAVQSLRAGECSAAVVGGVNVMLKPAFPLAMCKGGFLSPAGRCMAFDERAAGYVRGEGAGVVILKPLEAALRDNDLIYATIVASGTNQDGHTQGISFPNGEAQVALMERVYESHNIRRDQVRYVEAHGTGTQAGDPAEALALDRVLGKGRNPDDRLLVGSVKTNIGHLEAGAGVAGLIKAALVLERQEVPPNLHFQTPNPKIPFDKMCLEVPTTHRSLPLPEDGSPALVGVNSFGYGGANVHVVLSQHCEDSTQLSGGDSKVRDELDVLRADREAPWLFPLSARHPDAITALSAAFARALEDQTTIQDFGHTLVHRRAHLSYRLTVLARSKEELVDRLKSHASGRQVQGVHLHRQPASQSPLVFIYTGMGPQWWAMGRELGAAEPVFRAALKEVDQVFRARLGWSLLKELDAEEHCSRMASTQVAQTANFAIQYALTRLWSSWGIEPDAVVGHSVGEVAAAWASGALSLEQAVAVSFHRSTQQQRTAGEGTMLATGLTEEQARRFCAETEGISVAAINGLTSVVLAGDRPALEEVDLLLEELGVFHRFLDVEVAYHSHQMDRLKPELLDALKELKPGPTRIPLYSTVTGQRIEGEELDAAYWWQNVRQPVRLADALTTIFDDGYTTCVEVGPHPVLRNAIKEMMTARGVNGTILFSLRRGNPEPEQMLENLGALYGLGHPIFWDKVCPTDGAVVRLATYPWQRQRYWEESEASLEQACGRPHAHVFLQTDLRQARPSWEAELNEHFFPYLKDHRIQGSVVFPGAAYIEAGLAIAAQSGTGRLVLEDLDFHQMLVVVDGKVQRLQLSYDPRSASFFVAAGAVGEQNWKIHATGRIVNDSLETSLAPRDLEQLMARFESFSVKPEVLYEKLKNRGLEYGPCFQTIEHLMTAGEEVLARLSVYDPKRYAEDHYLVHPTLLDGAFQALIAVLGTLSAVEDAAIVPVGVDRLVVHRQLGSKAIAHARIKRATSREVQADLTWFDDQGVACVEMQGLTLQPIAIGVEPEIDSRVEHYRMRWTPQELAAPETIPETTAEPQWDLGAILLIGVGERVESLATRVEARGVPTVTVAFAEAFDRLKQASFDRVIFVPEAPRTQNLSELVEEDTVQLVELVRSLEQLDKPPTLIVVTHQVQFTAGLVGPTTPAKLGRWGLWAAGRVVRSEYPRISCTFVDLADSSEECLRRLVDEVLADDPESEVVLEGGLRRVHRMEVVEHSAAKGETKLIKVNTGETPVKLALQTPGQLGTLHWKRSERRPPGAGEVEIQVAFAGINFKDILKFSGQISPRVTRDTFMEDEVGMECFGQVVAVGQGVEHVTVGDEIMATISEGCFQSYVTTNSPYVVKQPANTTGEEAVVVVPFMTAIYGLCDIARLRAGERVLIHNASGGVGLAAIQVAQKVGAQVFATAGTAEKRDYLRELGVQYVTDSRSLQFVDDIRGWTDGEGVDVVLSALTGEALIESFHLLNTYGRYIDIGKKDFVENSLLPMRAFNRGLTYSALDMDRIFRDRVDDVLDVIERMQRGFEEGYYRAIPTQSFPASDIAGALRFMAQARHIGKLVVAVANQEIEVPTDEAPRLVRADGTYLVSGGLDGFGREVARWLATKGAGGLVLLSRRGKTAPGAEETREELEALGARVRIEAVDVTDAEALSTVLHDARASMGPLRGVFHSAMVLDDQFIHALTRERLRRVLRPKVEGAWNLHAATIDDPLEHFLCFSSISSLVGNAGQVSYVAANGFLDGLAVYRRRLGLPALTINWGALGEVGVVTRSREVSMALESAGIRGMTTKEALQAMERAMVGHDAQLGMFDIDWSRWETLNPQTARLPMYRTVCALSQADKMARPTLALARELLSVETEQRGAVVADRLRQEISALLRLDVDRIGLHQALSDLGVDSLLAMELVASLQKQGFELTVVDMMQGPTLTQLADKVVAQLDALTRHNAEWLLEKVDEMEESEVDRLLEILQSNA